MRFLSIGLVLWLSAVTLVSSQTPAPPIRSHNLRVIGFLTKHEWEAKLPVTPDGKQTTIHAQFTWSQNGQAIRVSNQFVADGKARPYLEGLYMWDPQQRTIVFWYVDAEGSLTRGKMKTEGGKLVHEFDQIAPDGKSTAYVAKVTPQAEHAWENEIFERRGTKLKPMVNVRYEIASE